MSNRSRDILPELRQRYPGLIRDDLEGVFIAYEINKWMLVVFEPDTVREIDLAIYRGFLYISRGSPDQIAHGFLTLDPYFALVPTALFPPEALEQIPISELDVHHFTLANPSSNRKFIPEITRLFNLGYDQLTARDYNGGVDTFKRITQLDPNYSEVWYNLSVAMYGIQDYSGAIRAVRNALALTPEHIEDRFLLGILLDHQHQDTNAINSYDQVVHLDPLLETVMGKYASARKQYLERFLGQKRSRKTGRHFVNDSPQQRKLDFPQKKSKKNDSI